MTDQALSARIILITGAGSGMGRVMARAVAAAGATVAGVDVDSSGLDQLAREPVFRDRLRKIVADVSKAEDGRQAVADVQKTFGSLDVLINCAGISMAHAAPQPQARLKFFEADPAGWRLGTHHQCDHELRHHAGGGAVCLWRFQGGARGELRDLGKGS